MKVLIDIGHPAHVHLFRNLADSFRQKGHTVLFTCRDKEVTIQLLRYYSFRFISFGKQFRSSFGKAWGLIIFNLKMIQVLRRYKPDITLGHGSVYAAQMSCLSGIPNISLEDTGNMEQVRLYRPFTKAILVPDSFPRELGRKQIRYAGNHELAYLHPERFTPDKTIRDMLGVKEHEQYVLLRFVGWDASHDKGHQGISTENKRTLVTEFSKYAKVFISSEKELPDDLKQYLLPVSPGNIHHVIAFSSLVYGESSTMVSEAAVLGIPGILVNDSFLGYIHEEEKSGLVYTFSESETDFGKSLEKGIEIIADPDSQHIRNKNRQTLIDDKIDVTAFLVWFVENWPDSYKIMKEQPARQYIFR